MTYYEALTLKEISLFAISEIPEVIEELKKIAMLKNEVVKYVKWRFA